MKTQISLVAVIMTSFVSVAMGHGLVAPSLSEKSLGAGSRCEEVLRGGFHPAHRATYSLLADAIDGAEKPMTAKMLPGTKMKAREALGLTSLFKDELERIRVNAYFEENERSNGGLVEIFVAGNRGIDEIEIFEGTFSRADLLVWPRGPLGNFDEVKRNLTPAEMAKIAGSADIGFLLKGGASKARKFVAIEKLGTNLPTMRIGVDVPCKDIASYADADEAEIREIKVGKETLCRVSILEISMK